MFELTACIKRANISDDLNNVAWLLVSAVSIATGLLEPGLWHWIPSMTNRMKIIERNMMFEVLSFQKKDWQQVMA